MTVSASTAPASGFRVSLKPVKVSQSLDHSSSTLRHPAALRLRRAEVEEAASPGNQSRSARFWKFPPAIRCRESPAAAGSAAIIRPSQELSRFAAPTLCYFVLPRNTKNGRRCEEPVDVETSLWTPEEI